MSINKARPIFRASSESGVTELSPQGKLHGEVEYNPDAAATVSQSRPPPLPLSHIQTAPSPRSSPRSSSRSLLTPSRTLSQPASVGISFSEYVTSELAQGQALSDSISSANTSRTDVPGSGIAPDPVNTSNIWDREHQQGIDPQNHASRLPALPIPQDGIRMFSGQHEERRFQPGILGRYGKLACFQLDVSGKITQREMTRADILQEARDTFNISQPSTMAIDRRRTGDDHVRSPSPEMKDSRKALTCEKGSRRVMPKALRDHLRNSLQARDIRQVDPSFAAKPALWIRHSAFVVSLDGLRAIILRDKMFIFEPDNVRTRQLVYFARQSVMAKTESEDLDPFEFKALEGILIYLLMGLEREFNQLKLIITQYLNQMPSELTTKLLGALREQKQKLNYFHAKANNVKTILENLLDDEDQMSNMYLTENYMSKSANVTGIVDHSEIETILEAYLQVIDQLANDSSSLIDGINDTEDLVMIHLDTLRNKLLSFKLEVSVFGLAASFGGLLVGMFGMNIPIALFDTVRTSSRFILISLGIVALVLFIVGISIRTIRRGGLRSLH